MRMQEGVDPSSWLVGASRGLLDVLLDVRCLRCGRAGCAWCKPCLTDAWSPQVGNGPTGLRVVAAAPYDGAVRRAVIAHKERGQLGLVRPMGQLLARAVAGVGIEGKVDLVPCPSAPEAVRGRGQDHARRLAAQAARVLRREHQDVRVVTPLRLSRAVIDQVGLGFQQRWENRRDTVVAEPASRRAARVIIVDDITTSGSTLGEAERALRAAGWSVLGAAVVAQARPPNGCRGHEDAGLA